MTKTLIDIIFFGLILVVIFYLRKNKKSEIRELIKDPRTGIFKDRQEN